jgi:hypothetical protein
MRGEGAGLSPAGFCWLSKRERKTNRRVASVLRGLSGTKRERLISKGFLRYSPQHGFGENRTLIPLKSLAIPAGFEPATHGVEIRTLRLISLRNWAFCCRFVAYRRSFDRELATQLGRGTKKGFRLRAVATLSKNRLTVEHLRIACRHVDELIAAGVTENLAIRTLELFSDVYAKMLNGGSATPHHVDQVKHWSVAARKIREDNPHARPKDHFRVEHGTPRRGFARKVLILYHDENLNEATMAAAVAQYWKLAVITLEEDIRLNKLARSTMFERPSASVSLIACGIVSGYSPPCSCVSKLRPVPFICGSCGRLCGVIISNL